MSMRMPIAAIGCCLLIAGCGEDAGVVAARKANEEIERVAAAAAAAARRDEDDAKIAVLAALKDPDSAKFGRFKAYGEQACFTVNARNSFGGYTGDQQAFLARTGGKWGVFAIKGDLSHETCIQLISRMQSN
ncbi:MAG: hypothetical protein NT123_06820 [Proteobacteria bacterium]|nr:hypothetical protein [Pseudomonadota bacterium]